MRHVPLRVCERRGNHHNWLNLSEAYEIFRRWIHIIQNPEPIAAGGRRKNHQTIIETRAKSVAMPGMICDEIRDAIAIQVLADASVGSKNNTVDTNGTCTPGVNSLGP